MHTVGEFRRMLAGLAAITAGIALGGCASVPAAPEVVETKAVERHQDSKSSEDPDPGAQAQDARAKAAEAAAAGDESQALYLYVQATRLDPTDSESLFEIATIYARHDDHQQAARVYAGVVAIEPDYALALEGLGLAQFELRELEAARASLDRAAALDSTLWRPHNVLGLIADLEGAHSLAAEHYSKALALQPEMASLYNNRGYSRYLNSQWPEAEQDFRAAIALDSGYERAWKNLGLVYARQRNYDAALRALARVMERPVAANDVGYIAMLDGDYAAAETLFQEAARLSPRYFPLAAQNLAELRRRRGGEVLAREH